jgi:hypothetical protein
VQWEDRDAQDLVDMTQHGLASKTSPLSTVHAGMSTRTTRRTSRELGGG